MSDCWSVGQPDVDCLDNALCCFDGCVNVCQGAGEDNRISCVQRFYQSFISQAPSLLLRLPTLGPPRLCRCLNQPDNKISSQPRKFSRNQKFINKDRKLTRWKPTHGQTRWGEPKIKRHVHSLLMFMLMQSQQQPRPQQQPARRPQVNNNNRPYTGPQAESKPFVRCPSAMKCVPKVCSWILHYLTKVIPPVPGELQPGGSDGQWGPGLLPRRGDAQSSFDCKLYTRSYIVIEKWLVTCFSPVSTWLRVMWWTYAAVIPTTSENNL